MSLPKKRRSRRLRKKLHVGEFKEMGFRLKAELRNPLSSEAEIDLIHRFVSEVLDPRSLSIGGSITSGYIACYGRGSATDGDREAIRIGLSSRAEIASVKVGELEDAWYGPFDD